MKKYEKLTEITKKVLSTAKLVPKGKITTYKQIADYLGMPKSSRAIANALGKNTDIPATPCHRVVRSDGTVGGYARGMETKIRLLEKEGVAFVKGKIKEFKKVFYRLS